MAESSPTTVCGRSKADVRLTLLEFDWPEVFDLQEVKQTTKVLVLEKKRKQNCSLLTDTPNRSFQKPPVFLSLRVSTTLSTKHVVLFFRWFSHRTFFLSLFSLQVLHRQRWCPAQLCFPWTSGWESGGCALVPTRRSSPRCTHLCSSHPSPRNPTPLSPSSSSISTSA